MAGKSYVIAVLPGDGIGPEVTAEAMKVLAAASEKFNFSVTLEEALVGGIAIDTHNDPLPQFVVDMCRKSDAVFFGAVGGPKWDHLSIPNTPEYAIIRLREELGTYSNLRFAKTYDALKEIAPINPRYIKGGADILIVRELSEGIYYGKPRYRVKENGIERAVDTAVYTTPAIDRICRLAHDLAMGRSKRLSVVTKHNVMETSKLFRDVCYEVNKDYPEVELRSDIIDAASMKLILEPTEFDVIVTTNQFGDILGDEIAVIGGSLGLIPSAAMGDSGTHLYEPVHGSAPELEGMNVANPIGAILTAGLMARYSFELPEVADDIQSAVEATLAQGFRTRDIAGVNSNLVGTREFGDAVVDQIEDS